MSAMQQRPSEAAPPTREGTPRWHAKPASAALRHFGTDRHAGLSGAEARARLSRCGPNRLPEPPPPGLLARILEQVRNPLILFLVAAGLLSLLLDHAVDAAVIFAVVVANAVIGLVQEGRAERALAAIGQILAPRAVVVRDGTRVEIPAADVVPGDILLLEAGDRVSADMRLVEARLLRIDESLLTGESVPVEKTGATAAPDAPPGDRAGMAHAGTLVTSGQGLGVVVATGAATELGRISGMLATIETRATPLVQQMAGFARRLSLLILLLSAGAFLFALLVRGEPLDEAFMLMVALGVAAIPEGLPAVMTVTLAIGVQRMAARKALIRRLPAVETLGCVSVIASDKTGTLTRNEMTVTALQTSAGPAAVSGAGLAPDGRIEPESGPARALALAGLLASDAGLRETGAGWAAVGDPMEAALVSLAAKAGLDPEPTREAHARLDLMPFDPATRIMASLDTGPEGGATVHLKGAPEAILAISDRLAGDGGDLPLHAAAWLDAADRLAARGLRVLAFAEKPAPGLARITAADIGGGCRFLGLAGFIDPPRPEAVEAVSQCRTAGIHIAMITGDHAMTARAIARELGLGEDPAVLTGADLARLDDAALGRAIAEVVVFARTSPADKLRLLEAYQRAGHFAAMTGDGVNDTPALKRADIGIAMGAKGSEAARQVSDMVLADDNFASIAAAVREGRTVHDNISKVIAWTLPTNAGEALVLLAALALGIALPITPLQILWVNTVTAVALGLTLAFEPAEPGIMRRPPRPPDQPLLTAALMWRILFVSLLFVAGVLAIYTDAKARGLTLEEARTLVVNALVVMEIFYLFAVRYAHGPSLTRQGLLGTPAVLFGVGATIVAQLALTFWPPLQALFDTRPVALADGLRVIGIGLVLFLAVEVEKRLRARAGAVSRR